MLKIFIITAFCISHSVTTSIYAFGSAHKEKIRFTENKGQWDKDIVYRADIANGYIFFQNDGFTYLFYENPFLDTTHDHLEKDENKNLRVAPDPCNVEYHSVKVEFLNASPEVELSGKYKKREQLNYILGNDPNYWAHNVRSFEEIKYQNIYPGITIKFFSHEGSLKYDIIVQPGADPNGVKMKYSGADRLFIENQQLHAHTSLQNISELKPYTYQLDRNETSVEIHTKFVLENNILSFDVSSYDHSKKLIIDPSLVFSTFSGSTADNWGFSATFDENGNTYSGGIVTLNVGGSLPATTGAFSESFNGGIWDIAIFKYDSTGSNLIYGTYLGGSGNEFPHSLIVNNAGELLILGSTGSADFPTTGNSYESVFKGGPTFDATQRNGVLISATGTDLFIAKLSSDGQALMNSTFLGGSNNDGVGEVNLDALVKNYGDQFRGDIVVDSNDNVYIASNTRSLDFPKINGIQNYGGGRRDAVITKLNSSLSNVIWSTFYGGSGEDVAYSIKVVDNDNVLISGGTGSVDLPGTINGLNPSSLGGIDGFATIISNDGNTIINSTYLGTDKNDQTYFTDFDENFQAYFLGQTQGNYPVTPGTFNNQFGGQFIHKLSADLRTTVFSTKFGSGTISNTGLVVPDISPTAFLVSECDKFYLSGWGSNSSQFGSNGGYQGLNINGLPLTNGAFQQKANNGAFYLAVFEANAKELIFSTYFGGSVASAHVDGGTSRFDKRGIIYQSVCSCGGQEDNFPTNSEAWSTTNNSISAVNANGDPFPRCNNAVFKFDLATLKARLSTNSTLGDQPGPSEVCLPSSILFTNISNGGIKLEWDLGDGTIIENMDSVVHFYENPGFYKVSLRIEDESTCEQVDVAFKNITVREGSFTISEDDSICEGTSFQLSATGGDSYNWSINNDTIVVLTGPNPIVSPTTNTLYKLVANTVDGCVWQDSVEVRVIKQPKSDFEIYKSYQCMQNPTFELTNLSDPSEALSWNFGDGMTSDEKDVTYQYEGEGSFFIQLETTTEFCNDLKRIEVKSQQLFLPNVITPNADGKNDSFIIPNDGNAELSIVNRYGDEIFNSIDYQNNWEARNEPDGVYYYNLTMPDSTECKGLVHVIR